MLGAQPAARDAERPLHELLNDITVVFKVHINYILASTEYRYPVALQHIQQPAILRFDRLFAGSVTSACLLAINHLSELKYHQQYDWQICAACSCIS